eukprot:7982625-Ditylum_brightwellii.AAC.1
MEGRSAPAVMSINSKKYIFSSPKVMMNAAIAATTTQTFIWGSSTHTTAAIQRNRTKACALQT